MLLPHRLRLLAIVAFACLTCLAPSPWAEAEQPIAQKPNVLILIADDLGYADTGFSEHTPADVQTPGLDRLRAMGARFTNAYATSPICSPSRVGLSTGRYQQRWGNYWYNEGGLTLDEKTIAHYLRQNGYATKKVGKNHMNGGPANHPLDHGFDEFLGFNDHTWDYIRLQQADVDAMKAAMPEGRTWRQNANGLGPLIRNRDGVAEYPDGSYTTEVFTDEAIEFMTRDRDEQPWFVQLEYNAVHQPTYVCDPDYAAKFGLPEELWDRDASEWSFPYWDPRKVAWEEWHQDWGHLKAIDPQGRLRYLTHLAGMDDSVAKLLNTLEQSGELDNTIIVFTSDNGGTINTYSDNTPLRGHKYMFGEGGIRVPMLIHAPGITQANQTIDALTTCMDILPTVTDYCGITAGQTPNHTLDGNNLLPLVQDETQSNHDHLVWDKGRGDCWVLRQGDWKLTHNAKWNHLGFKLVDGKAIRSEENDTFPDGLCLFNLAEDIGETTNLADQHPQKVAELQGLYQAWHSQMSGPRSRDKRLQRTADQFN